MVKEESGFVDFLQGIFFSLAFAVFSVFYFPSFRKRLEQAKNASELLSQRRGQYSEGLLNKLESKRVIWIHAVSVGEVVSIRSFVKRLLEDYPGYHLFLTTVTPTGQALAKQMESENVSVAYFPFDFAWTVRRVLNQVKPELILLVETEIWPNFILQATRSAKSVGIINARLSERSRQRYRMFSWLFGRIFKRLDFVLTQTQEDRDRFESLGVKNSAVHVCGNLKFENSSSSSQSSIERERLKERWAIEEHSQVWVSGSTHSGEEEIALNVYCKLKDRNPNLKLILVPRHIERKEEILKLVQNRELSFQVSSEFKTDTPYEVLVVDQMGILNEFYCLADVVFVGGSLVRHGGQNPIEPASFARAIVHGPHIFNFTKVYQVFNESDGALQIQSEAQLEDVLKELLENPQRRGQIGRNAYRVIQSMQGALEQHFEQLSLYLKPRIKERV